MTEVMVATAVAGVVALGLAQVASFSLKNQARSGAAAELQEITSMIQMLAESDAMCGQVLDTGTNFSPSASTFELNQLKIGSRVALRKGAWVKGLRATSIELSRVGAPVEQKEASTGRYYSYQVFGLALKASVKEGGPPFESSVPAAFVLKFGPTRNTAGNPTPGTAGRLVGCQAPDDEAKKRSVCEQNGGVYQPALTPKCRLSGAMAGCTSVEWSKEFPGPLPPTGPVGGYVVQKSCPSGTRVFSGTGGCYGYGGGVLKEATRVSSTTWRVTCNQTKGLLNGQSVYAAMVFLCCP